MPNPRIRNWSPISTLKKGEVLEFECGRCHRTGMVTLLQLVRRNISLETPIEAILPVNITHVQPEDPTSAFDEGFRPVLTKEGSDSSIFRFMADRDDNAKYLPSRTFADTLTLGTGNDRIDLHYFGAGHTNGDAWVVFPTQRVVHAGDLLGSKQPPPIDLDNGGSGLAYPDTLTKAASTLKNVDTIIPGHGPLMTMKDLEEYARFCREFRESVVSGFGHGLSIGESVEGWTVPPGRYTGYTSPAERTTSAARAIFGELTR